MVDERASETLAVQGTLVVGEAVEDWTGDARLFEYSQAADRSTYLRTLDIRFSSPT